MDYFPSPYIDELFYSVLARYLRHTGYSSYYLSSQIGISKFNFLMPGNLLNVITKINDVYTITVEKVIEDHTLFPFWNKFMSEKSALKIFNSMQVGNGHLSLWRNKVDYFSYCPLCVNADRELHGETFWHRVHNISVVKSCLLHRCKLFRVFQPRMYTLKTFLNTESLIRNNKMQIEYVSDFQHRMDKEWVQLIQEVPSFSSKEFAKELLNLGALKSIKKSFWVNDNFINTFYLFQKSEFGSVNYSKSEIRDLSLTVAHDRSLVNQPLFLLTLKRFIDSSSDSFHTRSMNEFTPVCINNYCQSYKDILSSDCWHSLKINHAIPGFFATCPSCEMSYRGKLVNKKLSTTIVQYGEPIRIMILDYLNRGLSLRKIEKELNIGRRSLKKIVDYTFNSNLKANKKQNTMLEKRKAKWLLIIRKYGGSGIDFCRKKFKTEYRFLLKHDSRWMIKINKPFYRRQTGAPKKNIHGLDEKVLTEFITRYNCLIQNQFNYKITKTLFIAPSKFLGATNIKSLPLSFQYINSVTEHRFDFLKRLVNYKYDAYKNFGSSFKFQSYCADIINRAKSEVLRIQISNYVLSLQKKLNLNL